MIADEDGSVLLSPEDVRRLRHMIESLQRNVRYSLVFTGPEVTGFLREWCNLFPADTGENQ